MAGGVLVGGTLLAIGATLHTTIVAAMKIDETVTQKFQEFKDNRQAAVDVPHERSLYDVKSSISKIRSDSLESVKQGNKNQM